MDPFNQKVPSEYSDKVKAMASHMNMDISPADFMTKLNSIDLTGSKNDDAKSSTNLVDPYKLTALEKFTNLFKREFGVVIGMIHIHALPGTPASRLSVNEIKRLALIEADKYISAGVDAIMIENMHDTPYLNRNVGPEIISAMTVICNAVRTRVPEEIPMGIQILAGANEAALAVAHACNLQFIRAEGFVFSHVADEGMMHACAANLLRYRRNIGADNILIFTDIKKKHSSHVVTMDVTIEDTAKAADFFRSDGVIITGSATGEAADKKHLDAVSTSVPKLPVMIGSGVTLKNVKAYLNANALIVGSYFKKDGHWMNDVDEVTVVEFMARVKDLRERRAGLHEKVKEKKPKKSKKKSKKKEKSSDDDDSSED